MYVECRKYTNCMLQEPGKQDLLKNGMQGGTWDERVEEKKGWVSLPSQLKHTLQTRTLYKLDSQLPLSVTMEKSAQPGEGEGCTPTPVHYIYHHVQRSGVRSSWEGRCTPPLVLFYPYMYSVTTTFPVIVTLSPPWRCVQARFLGIGTKILFHCYEIFNAKKMCF